MSRRFAQALGLVLFTACAHDGPMPPAPPVGPIGPMGAVSGQTNAATLAGVGAAHAPEPPQKAEVKPNEKTTAPLADAQAGSAPVVAATDAHTPVPEARSAIFGKVLTADEKQKVASLCASIDALYRKNHWSGSSICSKVNFTLFGYSLKGRPLVQVSFGDPKSAKMTLIQCAIHGDELPSLPMCFNLINEVITGKKLPPKEAFLVVQPLLNPDGMLEGKPQRPNLNGIDINRNFPTIDFAEKAKEVWQKRDKADPRKFPGEKANSEPETQALVDFIASTRPQKIIAIHTPLGHLDLDAKGAVDQERRARFLAINMSKNSGNYQFKTFGFFPGSLGNYAGREKQIPVYTLELPPGLSKPTVDTYWKRFRIALWRAIDFDLETGQFFED